MVNFNPSLSALNAFSQGMHANAHNVANVNTNNYRAAQTTFNESQNKDGVTASITQQRLPEREPTQMESYAPNNNVDYARETVNSIIYQRGFEANTATIRTQDNMLGALLDMKI